MSTRVHELAKDLGLKSQELLDRIQKSGLDVKPSPLASLGEDQVAQIRKLIGAPATEAAPPPKPKPESAPVPPAAAQPTPPEASAIPTTVAPTAPRSPSVETGPRSETAERAPADRDRPKQTAPQPSKPEQPSGEPPRIQPHQRPVGPSSPGPLAGHSRGGHQTQRPGGGPLSGHTSGRSAAPSGPRAESGGGSSHHHEPRPQPTSPPPLRPSDYMGPAGTRVSPPSNLNRPGGGQPPVRRPGGRPQGPAADGPRRENAGPGGSRRPLPPVAASATPTAPRRTEAPRPTAPAAKTQRPDMKLTPAQIREMMSTGQIGGPGASALPGQPTRTGAPAGRGDRPLRPAGPAGPAAAPTGSDAEEEERKGKGGRLGGAADRAGRRKARAARATDGSTRVSSPVDARALISGDDDDGRRSRGPRRHRGSRGATIAPRKTHVQIEPPITLRDLSEATGLKANDLMRKLMSLGQLVTINSTLDDETAMMLSMEFGVELDVVYPRTAEDEVFDLIEGPSEGEDEGLELRPPIITILGHVDHGKTSLLDKIRRANVVASETGGITQHIGAYQIEHEGRKVSFVDTPGHEAFTAMRARGANVTDIVVLVVAADDGVMPQTKEAIAHAKAAEVPVVVALNKIDIPDVDTTANIQKIYGELSQEGLHPVEWGGDCEVIKTSASTGLGIDDLLSTLETIAELHELKANPNRAATGTCLESSVSEGRGVVATVMVQDGTLRVGDALVCGDGFGRVRALFDDTGRSVPEAGPSTPVEVSGLDMVPTAGEKFAVLDDVTRAREVADARRHRTRGATLVDRQAVTLENLFERVAEQKVKSLNLIIKADVQGSLEALAKELEKLENPEVPIRVLLKGVGGISESDILLADASEAIVIGFRVAPEDRAVILGEEKKIDIRRYDIIYQVTDEVKKAVEGMLVPEVKEVHIGRAAVRQAFRISKVGTVAGCFVTQGTIERSAKARLIREGREIYKGSIEALKRFKDDVKEVREGFECGIKIANFDDVKVDDVIEAYRVEIIRRTL